MPSDDVKRILAELDEIQTEAALGEPNDALFERARSRVGHTDNDVRWQALIAVGMWVTTCPEEVWSVVLEHGESEDEDMRSGVATVLLEHLLEHHFDAYLPRLRERIDGGALLLADTLGRCWPFGQAEARWGEVQRVLRDAERSREQSKRGRRR